ncbi:SPFH domain-containing protein [Arthrobacter sp. E3]|uniref:SPFH domain-containing protein n=1 Tax=Arthrobacter sp. E3 TaxID=517402 RepID=UPI001A940EF2|nr:SPFH domain-containing protein [Arthrobacter sp. E3]
MTVIVAIIVVVVILALFALKLSIRVVTQYEMGVLFRLGRVTGTRSPGLTWIAPIVDRMPKVSLRIITMPIQSQGIITRDYVSVDWGVEVTLVELKDIQLPDSMKRAMARQAEAEREKRAKIINAEGESLAAAALGDASDTMMAHPLALQLRNLQSLIEIGVDKNTTVVFPAPLMSTIGELGAFLARETASAARMAPQNPPPAAPPVADLVSSVSNGAGRPAGSPAVHTQK